MLLYRNQTLWSRHRAKSFLPFKAMCCLHPSSLFLAFDYHLSPELRERKKTVGNHRYIGSKTGIGSFPVRGVVSFVRVSS